MLTQEKFIKKTLINNKKCYNLIAAYRNIKHPLKEALYFKFHSYKSEQVCTQR